MTNPDERIERLQQFAQLVAQGRAHGVDLGVRGGERGVRKEDRELLAAEPRHQVARAHRPAQLGGDPPEHQVR